MLNAVRPASFASAEALEARLQSFGPLRPADLNVLRSCGEDVRTAAAGSNIFGGNPPHDHPRVVHAGWGAAVRNLSDGRRQVLQVFLPGDVLGLSVLRFESAVALTSVTSSDARPLERAVATARPEHAGLLAAWDQAQSARQRQLLDHIVRLGRLSAIERTGHLLLELMDRYRRAGLSDGRRMPWPLTQEMLADVVGLSVVHVNRVLQHLRQDQLIILRAGQLVIPDADRLAGVAAWEG